MLIYFTIAVIFFIGFIIRRLQLVDILYLDDIFIALIVGLIFPFTTFFLLSVGVVYLWSKVKDKPLYTRKNNETKL